MINHCYKRVLIISNECLSQRTSNGRTLSNFLVGYPKECLAQFSVQGAAPDFERCERYFCVTDSEALQAFVKGKRVGKLLSPQREEVPAAPASMGHSRTALTMLLRDLIWSSGRWKKGGFRAFVEDFSPELLLLQAGDCAFMFKLALKLAKQYQIPIVVYNSEGYYFKKYDYFRASGVAHWCYPIFRRRLKKAFSKVMRKASHVVYNCSALQQDYSVHFSARSEVLYTATQLEPRRSSSENTLPRISYLGNLEVGRHASLIELAQILGELSSELRIDIYGKMPNEQVERELRACPQINLCGFVSYEDVVKTMQESDILLHAEGFDSFYREDSKYAFSTKIADSLACGTCFFVYAPEEFACSRYLAEHEAAYVVSELAEAKHVLKQLIELPQARSRYFENAMKLVRENHQADQNAKRFAELLNEVD